jgi:uncharacterized protein YjbJ (UPF0337 family)
MSAHPRARRNHVVPVVGPRVDPGLIALVSSVIHPTVPGTFGSGHLRETSGRTRAGPPKAAATTRKDAMTEKTTGPEAAIKGVVEDVKGKAKEAIGTVTGRNDLIREGHAQQDKAEAERDVARKEAEAEAARTAAAAAEKRQEAEQN